MKEIYVLRGGAYPADAIELDPEAGTYVPIGGGFVRHVGRDFTAVFRPATNEEMKSPLWRKAMFTIEPLEENVEGYTQGYLWNGWATPVFTKENAEKVLKGLCVPFNYDKATDTFTFNTDPDNESEEDSEQGYDIVTGPMHGPFVVGPRVYGIGSGSWTWEEVTQ